MVNLNVSSNKIEVFDDSYFFESEQIEAELYCGSRFEDEDDLAVIVCNHYLSLGIGRNITSLLRQIRNEYPNTNKISKRLIETYKIKFEWDKRAKLFDTQINEYRKQKFLHTINSDLISGIGRVFELINLYNHLKIEFEENGVWYVTSERGEQVNKFNSHLLQEMRNTLKDISDETGGRTHNQIEQDFGEYKQITREMNKQLSITDKLQNLTTEELKQLDLLLNKLESDVTNTR